jgi:hypothetical protein
MNLLARDARAKDYDAFARLFPHLHPPDDPMPIPTMDQFDASIRPHAFLLWEGARPVAYALWRRLDDVARVYHVCSQLVAPKTRPAPPGSLSVVAGVCERPPRLPKYT